MDKVLIKNRKGILDIAAILIFSFILVLGILFVYNAVYTLNTDIQADTTVGNVTKEQIGDFTDRFPTIFDNAFLILLIGMLIVSIILSSYLNNSAVWIVFAILTLIIILIASAMINNAYSDIAADSSMMAASFPIMNFVFNNILIVMIVFAGFNLIAIYGKRLS